MGERERILLAGDDPAEVSTLTRRLEVNNHIIIAEAFCLADISDMIVNGQLDFRVAILGSMPNGEKAAGMLRAAIKGVVIISYSSHQQAFGEINITTDQGLPTLLAEVKKISKDS